MLKKIFTNLIGHSIVVTARAIKIRNLELYSANNFEITPEQFVVLNTLKKEACSQAKLCELLFKDKSNMTRLVSVLESKGLILKKQKNEKGRQINEISLTEKGDNLCSQIIPSAESIRKKYLKDITEDELYTCIKVLDKIQKNLKEEHQ